MTVVSMVRVKTLLGAAGLFVAYVVTAKLGLEFDALGGVATTVWPPSGIALASLLRLGPGVWPGVTLAAFVVNGSQAGVSLFAAAIIAAGNTLELVVGAALLRRFGFRPQMARLRDVLLLVGAAALLSTALSATFGTAAIWATAGRPAAGYAVFWSTWWVGDLMSDLLIAPLLLTWTSDARVRGGGLRRTVEAAALLALLVLAGLVSFGLVFAGQLSELLRGTYTVWPFLVWSALRFGPRGAAATLVLMAGIAIGCAAMGLGPFVRGTPHDSLLVLQSYLAVTAVTTFTLAAAVAERRQAIMARDDFLSIASHELRTPLTALKLRLDMAVRALGAAVTGDDAERLASAVTASARHVGRLERLVDDLLDVSRLRADRLSLSLERTSLDELVRDATGRLGEELSRARSALELDLPGGVLGTLDRVRVQQVIANLVTNAIKYAPGKPVRVSLRVDGGRARITVSDQGPGIPRADQRRIFEPYHRLASARHLGGLGLGLYIGRQIAEAHGGSLAVESEPGAGAVFVLELPLDRSPAA